MFVGFVAFQVTRIPGRDWGISLALGFVSIPLGVLIRCVPTPPLELARDLTEDTFVPIQFILFYWPDGFSEAVTYVSLRSLRVSVSATS